MEKQNGSTKPKHCDSSLSSSTNGCTKSSPSPSKLHKDYKNEDLSELQDRPKINEASRRYLPNYIPIHKRVGELVRQKNDYIKQLKLESEVKKRSKEEAECTFTPSTLNQTKRSPVEFSNYAYSWLKKCKTELEKKEKEAEIEKYAEMKEKPDILEISKQMSARRSTTPVFERLYNDRKREKNETANSFSPMINSKSAKMIELKRDKAVFDRLYSLRKVKEKSPKNEEATRVKKRRMNKSYNFDENWSKSYQINASRGNIYDENSGISNVSYTDDLCALLKSIKGL
ncbi:unnamed protein product [Blepharisma stoltei]|uniref:Uncharacterized protein n=1 Tax=Blepharisma stoltei TaxID=1481888 RepID=A0AAU9IZG7_9CILI|nr:unnamed protein product [Blepharisma stoltei]